MTELMKCHEPIDHDKQQEELIESLDFEYLAKHHSEKMMEALDTFDRDLMWEYLKDEIEKYAESYNEPKWED